MKFIHSKNIQLCVIILYERVHSVHVSNCKIKFALISLSLYAPDKLYTHKAY